MKKILIALLAVVMLSGCGGSDNTDPNDNTVDNKNEVTYYFEVNDAKVYMNQDFSEVYDSLGQEQSKFTSPSCAFEGQEDNVYTYASYQLITYTNNNKEYIYSITLKDDTVSTKEGIYLGSVKNDIINVYGKNYSESNGSLTYKGKDMTIEFLLENDAVTQITYTAIVE